MKSHKLKTWPKFFQAVFYGEKTFEIRKNDRDFQVGDTLILEEYDPKIKEYTGNVITKRITYITNWEQREGNVVLSIQ